MAKRGQLRRTVVYTACAALLVLVLIALIAVLAARSFSANRALAPAASSAARETAPTLTESSDAGRSKQIAASSSPLSLVVEPQAGIAPVLAMINGASSSIDLIMYELEDSRVEHALEEAEARGVSVRVLLNGGYWGKPDDAGNPDMNTGAFTFLKNAGVPVRPTPPYFALTHQKTLVVDGREALIMTFNLTPKYYASSRDFAVLDTDEADVSAIGQVFSADWQGERIPASNGNDLMWSPGSQTALLALINGTKHSLFIYSEEMDDPAVTEALEEAARRGVRVEVDMTYSEKWVPAFEALQAAGVAVRTYAPDAPLYIHAKMILADGSHAFIGSENFSPTSLNNNRELGIIITSPAILNSLADTFAQDWQQAMPFSTQ